MNVELALLADYAASMPGGKFIAAGVFDRITPPEMPWRHPTMFVILRIHVHPGEEGSHQIKLRLVDPDGKEIFQLNSDAEIDDIDPVEGSTVQIVLALNNVTFQVFGRHAFDVFLDNRYEHTVALKIAKRPTATMPSSNH